MGKGVERKTLVGGRSPQLRKVRARDWSAAKAKRFIAALGETCNVTLASQTAGVSSGAVYRRRAVDAAFRAQWGQALAAAYARLELMLLERALHGVEKIVPVKMREPTVMREYSDRTALTLLKMHRDKAIAEEMEVDPSDHQEAMDRILARIERVRERQRIETKAAPDRFERICRALRPA